MPGDGSPAAAPPRDGEAPQQRCCLGVLYYSQAMQEQGRRPVCLGVPHTPSEPVHLDDQKQLPGSADFKFVCLGHSLYERSAPGRPGPGGDGSRAGGVAQQEQQQQQQPMPYCEGLEVILGTSVEGAHLAQTAAVHSAAAGRPPDELSDVLTSMFGGEDSAFVRGAAKFNKIASRNWERMKSTASQAYTVTIKQLIDKISPGDS